MPLKPHVRDATDNLLESDKSNNTTTSSTAESTSIKVDTVPLHLGNLIHQSEDLRKSDIKSEIPSNGINNSEGTTLEQERTKSLSSTEQIQEMKQDTEKYQPLRKDKDSEYLSLADKYSTIRLVTNHSVSTEQVMPINGTSTYNPEKFANDSDISLQTNDGNYYYNEIYSIHS